MYFANCALIADVLFTTLIAKILIENLRLSFSVETGIDLNLFLNFEQKWVSCSYKIVLIRKSVIDI